MWTGGGMVLAATKRGTFLCSEGEGTAEAVQKGAEWHFGPGVTVRQTAPTRWDVRR